MGLVDVAYAARRYALYGWQILPLFTPEGDHCDCGRADCDGTSRGKHPRAGLSWECASSDFQKVETWWKRWPTANLGLQPGRSGLVVVDIDTPEAMDTATQLECFRILTRTVRTGRPDFDGLHLYFKKPKWEVANRNLNGLEIKSARGYIVAPPSLHYSGQRYHSINSHPIAPLPAALIQALADREPSTRSRPTSVPRQLPVSDGGVSDQIGQGDRHNNLLALATHLLRKGLDLSTTCALVHDRNRARCHPPLDNSEVESLLGWAIHKAGVTGARVALGLPPSMH